MTPTGDVLNDQPGSGRVAAAAERAEVKAEAAAAAAALGKELKADRLKRKMTWPVYVAFLSTFGDKQRLNLSTVYKICAGRVKRPHDLTMLDLATRLRQARERDAQDQAGG